MKIIFSILYSLLRTLPSNPFLNKVRGYIVSKLVNGDNVLIAPKVFIQTQNHNFKRKDTLIRFQGESMKDVIIGDDVWLAYGVIVLPGCKIDNGSVI